MPLPPILQEDETFIAFDKPSGMLIAPDRWDKKRENMMGLVHDKFGHGVANVHRLDADTSGVVLCSKSKVALDPLVARLWDTSGSHAVEKAEYRDPRVTALARPGGNGRGPARELARFYADLLSPAPVLLSRAAFNALSKDEGFVEDYKKVTSEEPDLVRAEDLAPLFARMLAEMETGRGLFLLRGFPVAQYGKPDLRYMYVGLCRHLGTTLSQSPGGDHIGDVRNMNVDVNSPRGRAYTSNQKLTFHSDQADIVGLLVLRTAKTGGLSKLASALAIRNEIARTRPDLLEVLHQPFPWSWQEQQPVRLATRRPPAARATSSAPAASPTRWLGRRPTTCFVEHAFGFVERTVGGGHCPLGIGQAGVEAA